MLIYNSYTRSLEEFKVKNNIVNMYVCGPTVYNYLHFGNARPMIFFDIVRRYFLYLGNEVNFTSNITDVDDKIIERAILENKSIEEITDFYFKAYLKNITDLNNLMPTNLPKVTEHMDDIIKYIDKLIEKDVAYEVNGNVYFKVSKVLEYGNLSNQKISDLEVGARIEENSEKLHPNDFTLWKKTDIGTNWESPWSNGRPGWHTECVVMIDSIYGSKIDIHAGGMDLKFPHHENEIAQSLALNNHNLADFWMHNGLLNIDNSKMSKSLNNFILIKDLLHDYTANEIRLFFIQTPYMQPINFSVDIIEETKKINGKIGDLYCQLFQKIKFEGFEFEFQDVRIKEFETWMDKDFNTANALSVLFDLMKKGNALLRSNFNGEEISLVLSQMRGIFYVFGLEYHLPNISNDDVADYSKWIDLKKNKDFVNADVIRTQLKEKGILL